MEAVRTQSFPLLPPPQSPRPSLLRSIRPRLRRPVLPQIAWIPSGTGLPTLAIHATTTGASPYFAAVYPLPGAVPNGQSVESPEDPGLRGSVLSRWPDGSASVIVVAGSLVLTAGQPQTVSLRRGSATAGSLSPAQVGQVVKSIAFDFGAVGTATLSTFDSPERVWWANERVICARYRSPIGVDGLEAIIDIHAFDGDRALVEVVIENGRVDSAKPVDVSTKNYANAVVAINGNPVATVSSAAAPNGAHIGFRAWYCSAWIGGDPGVFVTHDPSVLQGHPLFWKAARPMKTNYAALYRADAYTPWTTGRHLSRNMGGTGEGARGPIGPLPGWDSDYICSGDPYAGQAAVANALALLTYNINYRDSSTGQPPSSAQLQGKRTGSGGWVKWPSVDYSFDDSKATFEAAHQPAGPLVAFMCRPSPAFIEIAQKILVWNHVNNSTNGVLMWDQGRARGWRMRNYAIAAFLTPDADTRWKDSARRLIANCVPEATQFQQPWNRLNVIWDYMVGDVEDKSRDRPRYQYNFFFQHYMILGWNFASAMKLLNAVDQKRFDDALNWLCEYATRYVNEASGGEWRLQNYMTTVGDLAGKTIAMAGDWGATLRADYVDVPPPDKGQWLFIEHSPGSNANWNRWSSATSARSAGIGYETKFFAVLVLAKERGVAGSESAWNRVVNNLSNLDSWADGFADNPIYNRWPRNA